MVGQVHGGSKWRRELGRALYIWWPYLELQEVDSLFHVWLWIIFSINEALNKIQAWVPVTFCTNCP